MNIEYIIIILIFSHFLADFTLQTDAMAKGKNRNRKIDYIPEGQKLVPVWPYWLSAHAIIHGGMLYIFTLNPYVFIVESISHFIIDFIKCENWTNPNQDQGLHGLMKIIEFIILVM